MGVKIINRKYNEIFTPGDTDWLLGNVGDWQTLELDVDVAIEMLPTTSEPVQVDGTRRAFVLANGKNWGDLGFDPGQTMRIHWKKHTYNESDGTTTVSNMSDSFPINNVSGSVMEVLNLLENYFDGNTSIPTDFGNNKITDVRMFVDSAPQGCRVKYVHLTNENFDTNQLASFIDNSVPEFVRPNVNTGSGWLPMEAVGIQSGMSIRKMEVKKIGKKPFTLNTYQFKIRVQFMISSIFEDPTTFETMTIPSYLNGDGSLTDNFKIEFYPEWNNPNTMIQNDLNWTLRKGNTGWFNENFNELNNDFKIKSVQYFDENGNVVDGLDFATATKVKAVIGGVTNLTNLTECGFGFAWIPVNDSDFKNKKTPLYQNLYIQSGSLNDGFPLDINHPDTYTGAGVDGASMDAKNVKFTKVGTDIIFETTFIPNGGFFTKFDSKDESDRNFVIWVSVADGSLARNFSDRVSLLVDHGMMAKNIPPAGNYAFIDNAFIEHPQLENVVGESVLEGITQDDILCRMPFRIPNDGSITFNQMSFGVEAFNVGTGADFALEQFDVELNTFPVAGGIQQFDFDQSRGFKLNPGNNKNWVKIYREPALDTPDFVGYMAYFATKIRWEHWISNPNTPSDFFKADAPNKGFHNDWIEYLRTSGWSLNFFTEINVTESGSVKQYKNQWKIKLVDYDENPNVSVDHKYFRHSTNTLLNVGTDPETGRPLGVILNNEPTRIEIAFDIVGAGVWDLANTYGVTTIEIDRGAGRMEQRQLSSVWESEGDNPLKPVEGQTKLKMAVDVTGNILTTTCLVDPELLTDATKYRITGRVGCINTGSGGQFDPGLYEFRYESIYE